jgi:hypothetical protein
MYGRGKIPVKKNYTLGCDFFFLIFFFKNPEFWSLNGMVAVKFR